MKKSDRSAVYITRAYYKKRRKKKNKILNDDGGGFTLEIEFLSQQRHRAPLSLSA